MKYKVVGIGQDGSKLTGIQEAKSPDSAIAKTKAHWNRVHALTGRKIDLNSYRWSAEI